MKLFDLITLAFQNLYGNRMRSLLTVLGVGVGIGAIIFFVGLGFGLQKLTVEQLTTSSTVTTLEIYSDNPDILKIDPDVVERVRNFPEVEKVSAVINLPGQASYNNLTTESLIKVIDNEYYNLSGIKLLAGHKPAEAKQGLVSSGLLKLYNIDDYEAALGQILSISVFSIRAGEGAFQETPQLDIEIAGVFEDVVQLVEISRENSSSLQLAEEYSRLKAKARELDGVEQVEQKVTDLGFTVTSLVDKINEVDRVFRIIQLVLAGFGLVALTVASIGMFNTMTISLLERTRDIGVMKALGASKKDVRRLFILEAGIIGLLGGIVGIGLAWLLGLSINAGVNILASSAGAESMSVYYLPGSFLIGVLVFSLLVGLLTGVYPSLRASRLNPLQALRYE